MMMMMMMMTISALKVTTIQRKEVRRGVQGHGDGVVVHALMLRMQLSPSTMVGSPVVFCAVLGREMKTYLLLLLKRPTRKMIDLPTATPRRTSMTTTSTATTIEAVGDVDDDGDYSSFR